MSLEILFAVWGVALVLALLTIAIIIRPLYVVLTDVCGSKDRAWFWTVYASVLTTAAPLVAVSTPGLLDAVSQAGTGAILQRAVFYAMAGIIAALLVTGRAVWSPIARMLDTLASGARTQGRQ
jgi:cytochrome b subunit of formate dehydrogenase